MPFYLLGKASSNPVYIIQLNVYVECMAGKGTLGSLLETLLIPGSNVSDDKCLRNVFPTFAAKYANREWNQENVKVGILFEKRELVCYKSAEWQQPPCECFW